MKDILVLLTAMVITCSSSAQEITGAWNGVLDVQGTQLRLIFHVTQTQDGFSATMDSPDQGTNGILVPSTTFEDPIVKFEIPAGGIVYRGELSEGSINGVFTQNGQEFPLNLTREAIGKEQVKRPQEPAEPYSYYSEEVIFENEKANVKLAGTLTLPEKVGNFPVVILISGSGPQNRNEELMGHKPFLVISDYLTNNGIAVLRYDDRGVGESSGDFSTATSADFAGDVESAIAYLKTRTEIDAGKIGLVGHSEGGLIAPMVAAKSNDVSSIVLMAGSGIRGDKLILMQEELVERALGTSEKEIDELLKTNTEIYDLVINAKDSAELVSGLTSTLNESIENDSTQLPNGVSKEQFISQQIGLYSSSWVNYFLKLDPAESLQKVKCPVLAINGEKDLQVPPKENLAAIEEALAKAGNKDVTIKMYPDLNHLFQESETGSPMEYSKIEQTVSPIVLEDITKWIKSRTK